MIRKVFCALILNVVAMGVGAQDPPQAAMEALAGAQGFGAKRSDSAVPQPTQSGFASRRAGYYQCFERGCVYFSADTGIQAVSGPIFTRWVAEGYERGRLGFPMARQLRCYVPEADPRSEYQDFEGGSIVVSGSASRTTTVLGRRINKGGDCTTPATPGAPIARFRLTLNGLACHRPTYDDATQRDGVDDEVSIETISRLTDLTIGTVGQPARGTPAMGDTNGHATRIRAGSGWSIVGGNGGFKEGDTFPAGGTPWIRSGALSEDRLPLNVWEGNLTEGVNAAVILPSLWEEDGVGTDLQTPFLSASNAIAIDAQIAQAITAGNPFRVTGGVRAAFDSVRMYKSSAGPGTRPVGMKDRGTYYAAEPTVLILSYRTAMRIATSSNDGLPMGVFALEVRDDDALRGLYTLYFQVEIVP